jgi:hypothetical protein
MKSIIRKIFFRIFKKSPAELLVKCLPEFYVKKVRASFLFRDELFQKGSWLEKTVLTELIKNEERAYYGKSDAEKRRLNMEKYWGSDAGKEWHRQMAQRYDNPKGFEEYLSKRIGLFEQLNKLLQENPGVFTTICEIGTGNGMFIHFLKKNNLKGIHRYVGIDINKKQIEDNKVTYKGSGIEFDSDETIDWVNKNKGSKGVVFLAAGTLEYFTQVELETFLTTIKVGKGDIAVGIIEPVSFNLEKELNSKPRGNIMFSHNYPYIFDKLGYSIIYKEVKGEPLSENRDNKLVTLLATHNNQ